MVVVVQDALETPGRSIHPDKYLKRLLTVLRGSLRGITSANSSYRRLRNSHREFHESNSLWCCLIQMERISSFARRVSFKVFIFFFTLFSFTGLLLRNEILDIYISVFFFLFQNTNPRLYFQSFLPNSFNQKSLMSKEEVKKYTSVLEKYYFALNKLLFNWRKSKKISIQVFI